ncbi:phosducin-like protein 3 [Mayamaea pseudoterrestris]|nr:phosducin-like protein 3 [Mayamaea pseudoterrestris]
MQGNGVTNYATDAPTYAYTASTTEFDDELIRRQILTKEQVLYAKGASENTIQQLLAAEADAKVAESTEHGDVESNASGSSSDDDDLDEDDEIMQQYRQRRLEQQAAQSSFNQVIRIDRSEWTSQVNEASEHHWVVVCLSSTPCKTKCMEDSIQSLARHQQSRVKFVVIEAKHAFEHEWPHSYLPTLFLYRHGKMQHQLLSLKVDMTQTELESILEEHGSRMHAASIAIMTPDMMGV